MSIPTLSFIFLQSLREAKCQTLLISRCHLWNKEKFAVSFASVFPLRLAASFSTHDTSNLIFSSWLNGHRPLIGPSLLIPWGLELRQPLLSAAQRLFFGDKELNYTILVTLPPAGFHLSFQDTPIADGSVNSKSTDNENASLTLFLTVLGSRPGWTT